jgi:hypothetical protein
VTTSAEKQADIVRMRFSSMEVVEIELLPFNLDDIKNFMMKTIKNNTFSAKRDII